ncbi:VCBS repeat-containing protein [Lewinella sp. W8]|uniref:VCBS repeat-containing protein n=1 Tax=Lewinella sp. W8 TaxID=2528208 RepID=UPI001564752E|nr:VCBS repeat-containing protein [Lewinella sp. W8]
MMRHKIKALLALGVLLFLQQCGKEAQPTFGDQSSVPADAAFSLMTSPGNNPTGVDFENTLTYTEQLNPYTYRNFYNGGGVGIADFNGDGLQDIFLTGNLVGNRLYLNQGGFNFLDVTREAGVGCPDSWSTGVAIVDIDADGDQDIYVCKAGPPAGEKIPGMTGVRHNELFLNNGDATFREASAEYGLDIVGLSVHAAFFDYDQDGDLDAYLLNNSTRSTTGYDLREGLREIPDPEGGNKLLRNEGGRFVDVSQEAGIYSSNIGFGLGVTVGDVNEDGLPDLFVSNDFFERDYLYFNQGDGTFREQLTDYLPEISQGSMGADFADLNNDGLPELFVTEMLPRTEERRKTKAAFNGWNRYQLYRDKGYHQQFSRNVLQLNRGDGRFSEISRLAGVDATDWSWGALLFDMNNDGFRDIFVANGTGKDLLDQDYINFQANPAAIRRMVFEEGKSVTDVIDQMPSEALVNGVFAGGDGLQFREVAGEWGMDQKTFSNGAAYGDLDNDGDLDLVVNNIDAPVGIYRNNAATSGQLLHLRAAAAPNPDAIGAQVFAYSEKGLRYAELHPMRGFQSTVDKRLHFAGALDSVLIRWPNGDWESFVSVTEATIWSLKQGEGRSRTSDARPRPAATKGSAFTFTIEDTKARHEEDRPQEFDRDPLLFLGLNNEGPALALSSDRQWLYQGGAAGQNGTMFWVDDRFFLKATPLLLQDQNAENTDAVFFDADGDGDEDLYVANGSHQFGPASTALFDVLYFNEGRKFRRGKQVLPSARKPVASSCVRPHDVDGDGDLDLFVGGRLRPGLYGVPTESFLLINDGRGAFAPAIVPELERIGLVTDAHWANVSGNEREELIVATEWGAIKIISFDAAGRITGVESISGTAGLWHGLHLADVNADGRLDILAGNQGLNNRFRATVDQPMELHVNDFDGNGRAEQLLTQFAADGKSYPLNLRDDLVKQMPALRKQIPGYADYVGKTLADLFPADILERSEIGRVETLASIVLLNLPDGWTPKDLPLEAQLTPLYALTTTDLNGDGHLDVLAAGNQTVAKPEIGINAAGFGSVLLGDGTGNFTALGPAETNLVLRGDVRALVPAGTGRWLVGRSGGSTALLKLQTR